MTNGYTRRKVIRATMSGSLLFAGCQSPAYRSLDFARPTSPVTKQSTTIINVTVTASDRNIDEEKGRFRDVTVIGYTETKTVVCRHSVGTIDFDERYQVTMECSRKPDYLGFSISQAGCEYQTEMDVWRLIKADEGTEYESLQPRSCDDPALYIPSES